MERYMEERGSVKELMYGKDTEKAQESEGKMQERYGKGTEKS